MVILYLFAVVLFLFLFLFFSSSSSSSSWRCFLEHQPWFYFILFLFDDWILRISPLHCFFSPFFFPLLNFFM